MTEETKTKWFQEIHDEHQALGMSIDELLYHQKSQYQDILIFNNQHYGNVMVLDGCYMLSDVDEHMYHKALTTYGMSNLDCFVADAPRNDEGDAAPCNDGLKILVVGAGDGGIVRDLLQNWNEQIEKVTMVEIDADVIEVSKKFFPKIACEFDNPKLDLKVEDALAFIKSAEAASYDLILCDSTDPVGFAAGLIETDFYEDIKRVLKADGIFCAQSGSPFFQKAELEKARTNLAKVFDDVHTYYAPMMVYPGTVWSFTAAGAKIHNKSNIDLGEFVH